MDPRATTRVTLLAALTTAIGVTSGARAQSVAAVKEIVQVVKTGKAGSNTLQDARIGQPLAAGDRVRTAGRSGAGLRFPDQSLLRMGELTELVVTSPNRRDARILRGKLIADYKAPGTISGGYAVAAVRGTEVEYLVDEARKEAQVRCYHGRVFVGSAGNPVRAGSTREVTATTLTDANLIESDADWVGGEIRFVDGPYVRQAREITGFDRQTGVVTFKNALTEPAAGAAGVTGYLLVKDPRRRVVELRNNQGTTVRDGEDPTPPRSVPHVQFAGLERTPYFEGVAETGGVEAPFPGSEYQHVIQDRDISERDAIRDVTTGHNPADCGGAPLPPPTVKGRALLSRSLSAQFARDTGRAPTPEEIQLPANVRAGGFNLSDHVQFILEPFLVTSNQADTAGARFRVQGAKGDAYVELGYRYAFYGGKFFNGSSHHDVSEGFLQLKGKDGSVTAGRQHVFLGPVNNTDIGSLLGLESSDAVLYQLPLKGRYRQTVGYVFDSKALRPGGFRGGFARGQQYVGRGTVGYSVLGASDRGGIGFSVDGSQNIIRKTLDVYGEAGVNHRGRRVTTAGFYLPGVYQRYGVDVFLEYNQREGRDERFSLRLRKELGSGFMGQLFLDDRLGGRVIGGAGVVWTLKFR